MKEITIYKWGKSYIISKTPDMAVEKMMEDILYEIGGRENIFMG